MDGPGSDEGEARLVEGQPGGEMAQLSSREPALADNEPEDVHASASLAEVDPFQPTEQQPSSAEHNQSDALWTPLHVAVESGNVELVQKLMDRGDNLENAASDGRKPMLLAAELGFVEIVELLSRNASIESTDEVHHSTALIRACERNHHAVVRLLIEKGADIDAKRMDGQTPLLITVASGNKDLVQYLLQHGADKTAKSEDGKTAEDLAKDDEGLLKVLRQNYLLQGPEIGPKKSEPELRFKSVRFPERPEQEIRQAACKSIQAVVVQFFIGRSELRSQPVLVSVDELIYGKGPSALFDLPPKSPPLKASTSPQRQKAGRGDPTFTWYHIPANNKKWVNDLIVRLLAERKPDAAMPDDDFRSKLGLSTIEGRGTRQRTGAFSYMRPFSRPIKTDPMMTWNSEKMEQVISFIPYLNYETTENHREASQVAEGLHSMRRARDFNKTVHQAAPLPRSAAPHLPHHHGSPPVPFPVPPPGMPSSGKSRQRDAPRPGPQPSSSLPPGFFKARPPPPIASSDRPEEAAFSPVPRTPPVPPPLSSADIAPTSVTNTDLRVRGGLGPEATVVSPQPPKARQQSRFASLLPSYMRAKPAKKKAKRGTSNFMSHGLPRDDVPNALLMRGYGVPEKNGQIPFQPRRTLDQYFYSHLDDISRRDQDQVVYRYTKLDRSPKIFMVDQMWLWIINGDTLITCLPTRWRTETVKTSTRETMAVPEADLVQGPPIEPPVPWDDILRPFFTNPAHESWNQDPDIPDIVEVIDVEPTNGKHLSVHPRPHSQGNSTADPMDVQHRVMRHLKETAREPITSIYDLAGLIATSCVSVFDENQIPEEMQFFDFFERSIGSIIEGATRNLYDFKRELSHDPYHLDEPTHEPTDDDLNIARELDLLVEIEDIQDELRILKLVLKDQKKASQELDSVLLQGRKKLGLAHYESEEVHSIIDLSCLNHHSDRIVEMEKLAETAHDSLKHLIDLKQKQANFSEAISSRKLARETAKNTKLQIKQTEEMNKQAEETARQGKILMVFTVVTIIFLPLSFMAAFFAINIDAFPVNEAGKLELGYILKYMLSISFALAIPFVLLVFRIDDVKQMSKGVREGVLRALKSPRLVPVLGYGTLGLVFVVVPSVVWTSKLATTAKVAVTICLALAVLLVAFGMGLKKLVDQVRISTDLSTVTSSSGYFVPR